MNEAVSFVQDLAVIMIAAAVGGLLCRRLGLSPVVGYLVAGMAVGPFTPDWLGVVRDVDRVRLFAELGLVFLMFGIGLSFSLKRLRQMGLGVVLVAAGGALLVFTVARGVGESLGLERVGGMFFGALLVVSSSAVIGKLLNDSGTSHDKSSQLALGVTLVFFIVFFNVYQGVREVSPTLIANARMLGADKRNLLRHVYLPSATSWVFSSLHTSVGLAFVGAVVGEYLGSAAGVGYLILQAEGLFDVNTVFAGILVLTAFALILDGVVTRVERRLMRWQPTAGETEKL